MITGIFTILGVLLGFYLGNFREANKVIGEKIKEIKENKKPKWGEPFVVKTDEYKLEQEQLKKKEEEEIKKENDIITGK